MKLYDTSERTSLKNAQKLKKEKWLERTKDATGLCEPACILTKQTTFPWDEDITSSHASDSPALMALALVPEQLGSL